MALARLITRTPEYAQKLRQSLERAGYTVEFAEPETSYTLPADLQVDLDDPSAATSYIVTADGQEISFAYDELEREFVLAPLGRAVMSAVRPWIERFEHMKAQRAAQAEEAATPPPKPPPKPGPVPAATFRPVEPAAKSIYLPDPPAAPPAPEPVHVRGEEYFDGRGLRKNASAPMEQLEVSAPPPQAPATPKTPVMAALAQRAEEMRVRLVSAFHRQRAIIIAEPGRLREYDRAWLRAVPVAALIALAFLLGWSIAESDRAPLQPKAPAPVELAGPNAQEAAIVPLPEEKKRVTPATESKPPAPEKKRRVKPVEEEDVADDVVVIRHYPSKGVQATNQSGGVRRYSDVD